MSETLKLHAPNDLFLAHVKNCTQCKAATAENRRMALLCFKGIRLLTGKPPPNRAGGGAA